MLACGWLRSVCFLEDEPLVISFIGTRATRAIVCHVHMHVVLTLLYI